VNGNGNIREPSRPSIPLHSPFHSPIKNKRLQTQSSSSTPAAALHSSCTDPQSAIMDFLKKGEAYLQQHQQGQGQAQGQQQQQQQQGGSEDYGDKGTVQSSPVQSSPTCTSRSFKKNLALTYFFMKQPSISSRRRPATPSAVTRTRRSPMGPEVSMRRLPGMPAFLSAFYSFHYPELTNDALRSHVNPKYSN
jgi:hypothetical protein